MSVEPLINQFFCSLQFLSRVDVGIIAMKDFFKCLRLIADSIDRIYDRSGDRKLLLKIPAGPQDRLLKPIRSDGTARDGSDVSSAQTQSTMLLISSFIYQ